MGSLHMVLNPDEDPLFDELNILVETEDNRIIIDGQKNNHQLKSIAPKLLQYKIQGTNLAFITFHELGVIHILRAIINEELEEYFNNKVKYNDIISKITFNDKY